MPFFTFTIEDYSPFITYSQGDWSPGTSSDDSNVNKQVPKYSQSTFMKTNKAGATARIAFNGTGITVFGAKRGNHGLYVTNLDGNPNAPVNGSAPDPGLYQQALFDAHNLDQGLHTVEITNQNNGLFFDLDYITIEGNIGEDPNDSLHVVNYQDSDASFSYRPSASQWSTNPPNLGTFFGSSGHSTTSTGTSFDFAFNGQSVKPTSDGVSLYGPLSTSGSPYTVSLDGASPVTLQSSTDRYLPQALLFHATNIGGGQHHLQVAFAPNGNNQNFAVDYANVYTTNSNTNSTSGSSSGSNSNGGSGSNKENGTSSIDSSSSSSGLSAGAAAGITVAACVIAALIVALIFLLLRRRRQQHPEEMKHVNSTLAPYAAPQNGHRTNLATPSTTRSHLPPTFGSGAAAAGIPAAAINGGYATGYGSHPDLPANTQRHYNNPSESNGSSSNPGGRFASNPSSDGGISDMYGDLPSPVPVRKSRLQTRVSNEPSPPDYLSATYRQ